MTYIGNLGTQEREAGRANVQGHPRLVSDLEAGLEYMGPCLKKKKKMLITEAPPHKPNQHF